MWNVIASREVQLEVQGTFINSTLLIIRYILIYRAYVSVSISNIYLGGITFLTKQDQTFEKFAKISSFVLMLWKSFGKFAKISSFGIKVMKDFNDDSTLYLTPYCFRKGELYHYTRMGFSFVSVELICSLYGYILCQIFLIHPIYGSINYSMYKGEFLFFPLWKSINNQFKILFDKVV